MSGGHTQNVQIILGFITLRAKSLYMISTVTIYIFYKMNIVSQHCSMDLTIDLLFLCEILFKEVLHSFWFFRQCYFILSSMKSMCDISYNDLWRLWITPLSLVILHIVLEVSWLLPCKYCVWVLLVIKSLPKYLENHQGVNSLHETRSLLHWVQG